MNETTLNALINLFALFSSISESKKEEAKRVFSFYLQLHLGISSSDEYIKLFEELLELYGVDGELAFPIDMNHQARVISGNIRSRLNKEEQIMVFLRFLELARSGNTEKAQGLFLILAEVFEIAREEFEKLYRFINHTSSEELDSEEFLLVNSKESFSQEKSRHFYEKNLDGQLVFLHSSLIGNLIFIFRGKEDLTLEGNPIIPDRFYAFKEGGIIRGPRISPIYFIDIASRFVRHTTSKPFVFSGNELDFRFRNSDNGLHTFSFSEQSGQLVAIMGGSGVGKSTLINILNGNIPVQKGEIRINQFDIHKDKEKIEGLIGYVPQDDLLFEDLTVWENLYYNACLCFDGLSKNEIEEKVSRILQELELLPYKDLKVGNPLKKIISGGQRKRLNVAMELIREPAILFVDEPTSGLSSIDSEIVMLLLKQQARKGKLIVVNIHQPSSTIFKLFDKLWIIDKGGRPIYTGNPLDAIIYFKNEVHHVNSNICECANCGNVNPEQVLEIVETKMIDSSGNFTSQRRFSPEYWFHLYLERIKKFIQPNRDVPSEAPESGSKKPGRLKQFKIFFERNLRTKVTDRPYLLINLLEAPLLALIVAWFTRFSEGDQYFLFSNKSLISYLFMSIVVVLFMGMSISAEEIIKDRKILQRESFLNLSRFSYLNSKILFLILLSAFQTFCFVWIGNSILGIYHMNLVYWLVLFSVAFFSNMVGLNISSAFDSVVTIYILIPLLLIPQILLCGVIVKFDDLQSKNADKDLVPVVGDIMVSRWAFEALAVEQYRNNRYNAYFFEMEKEIAQARYRSEILTSELTGQIDLVTGWQNLKKNESETHRKLKIVQNEIRKLDQEACLPPFAPIDQLVPGRFSQTVADSAKAHLTRIKEFHHERYQKNRKAKERLIDQLGKEYGKQYLVDLKMKHHNQSLEALVLNSETKKVFKETPEGLMQKVVPIYKNPDLQNGRSHFLASQKNLFGWFIPTLWFNLGFIWLMCLLLYMALYYDWVRALISFPGNLAGKIRNRKPVARH